MRDAHDALAAIVPETELEERIVRDPEWIEGALWGQPRSGHPEGAVAAHILDVLANVDGVAVDSRDRERLRLVALLHDTFKHRVDHGRPRTGANHHATIARKFAARYLDDATVLDVIELHDEAFNAWGKGRRSGNWIAAEERARRLVDRLGHALPFYLRFFRADNGTPGKSPASLEWFERLVRGSER